MFAKIAFFCAALVAVSASGLIAAPLVNTGVSATSSTQDAYGNYAYRYDIKDAATAVATYAAPAVAAYAAPAVAAYAAPAVASYAAPALVGRVAYGGIAAPVLAGRVALRRIRRPCGLRRCSRTRSSPRTGIRSWHLRCWTRKGHPLRSDVRPEMDVFYGYE
ncbi:hypothetical protein CEXT_11711 [Caerostris extrusa]|uniref:Uncharacterized protein n=1 Tax=Caerostris extrusa TaxID=172846 RepID=A0AAV4TP74_CAEEX|nr:hypothetical protein CEXT_11711 [Caerostris extrusa]